MKKWGIENHQKQGKKSYDVPATHHHQQYRQKEKSNSSAHCYDDDGLRTQATYNKMEQMERKFSGIRFQ